MSNRDFMSDNQSTVQRSSKLPAPRPFAEQTTHQKAETTPQQGTAAPFSFSNINVFNPSDNGASSSSGQSPIQPKLTIGAPNDPYEQEADRVAQQVVQQIHTPQIARRTDDIQQTSAPFISQLPIQRQSNIPVGETSKGFEQNLNRARSGGNALDPNLQSQMGAAMGADFSGVKVHHDANADQLSQSIQAKAFTTGQDVFFRKGAYNPSSRSGQELIAHELTHVVQQNSGVRAKFEPSIQRQIQISHQSQPGIQRLVQAAENYNWEPIAKLYAICEAKSDYVSGSVSNIAGMTGGTIHMKDESGVFDAKDSMKGMRRAVEKSILKNANNPRAVLQGDFFDNMSDILRGSIKFRTINDLLIGLTTLKRSLGNLGLIVRGFKNRFNERNKAAGYRDVLINLSPRGLDFVFELQFHAQGMLEAKNHGGHGIYDELRIKKESLEFLLKKKLQAEETKSDKDPEKIEHIKAQIADQEAQIADLEAQSEAHYDAAYNDMTGASAKEAQAAEDLANFKLKMQANNKAQNIDAVYQAFVVNHNNKTAAEFRDQALAMIESVVGEAHTLEQSLERGSDGTFDPGGVDAALGQQLENRRAEKEARKRARQEAAANAKQ